MKPKLLDAINKKGTIIGAAITGIGTVVAFPQVQQAIVGLFQNPTPQTVGAAVGVLVTGFLVYYSHPVGTSSSADPTHQ